MVTLSLQRVSNSKFLLQTHQKYYITQYEELGFSKLTQMEVDTTIGGGYIFFGFGFGFLVTYYLFYLDHSFRIGISNSNHEGDREETVADQQLPFPDACQLNLELKLTDDRTDDGKEFAPVNASVLTVPHILRTRQRSDAKPEVPIKLRWERKRRMTCPPHQRTHQLSSHTVKRDLTLIDPIVLVS